MIIAVTGHRPNKLNNEYDGVGPVSNHIREALQRNIDQFIPTKMISGMALGVDMIWSELAIKNKIPLISALPCANHHKKWPEKAQKRWLNIINHKLCTTHFVSTNEYTAWCMQKRNEWMVNNCNMLIAVWDGTKGGTYNCIDYATTKLKQIIYITPLKINE